MAWSTRELAELAGTTVKAVRHYHKLDLLEEPERKENGYKQYGVTHLVRLLQITRLADLGVPLGRIATMGHADNNPNEALRVLDAELEGTIARLQRIRGELALIFENHSPASLPAGFGPVASTMSETDRSLIMIYSRVLDESAMQDMQKMVNDGPVTEVDAEFDALTLDADRATRRRIAEGLAPGLVGLLEKYEWLQDPGSRAPRGSAFAAGTMGEAIRALYNKAQLEVLYRAHLISTGADDKLSELEAVLDAKELAEPGAVAHRTDSP
jgi:DNA-binding transcriptional MerR regulator